MKLGIGGLLPISYAYAPVCTSVRRTHGVCARYFKRGNDVLTYTPPPSTLA
jgi:hypothetical protein